MIINWLQSLDSSITLAINSLHFELGDYFWQMVSLKEMWYPLYAIVLFFIIKRLGWKKGCLMVLAMIMTVVVCDQLANFTKMTVGRLRPCYNESMLAGGLHVLESRSGFFGFYSAHSGNAFGFAMSSLIAFKMDKNHSYSKYKWFIFIWAALVGLSRIFSGKHYFGDVMTGLAVGLAAGYCIASLARYITEKV